MINHILNELNGKSINSILKKEFSIPFKLIENEEFLELMIVVVPWKQRGTGIGKKFMKRLIELAEEQNKDIFLSPDDSYSEPEDMNKGELSKWYTKLGFKKKEKSDFRSHNTMCYYTKDWYMIKEIVENVAKKKADKILNDDFLDFLKTEYKINKKIIIKNKRTSKKVFGVVKIHELKAGKYIIRVEVAHLKLKYDYIAHEFIHIVQFLRGDLDEKDEDVVWKGKPYILIKDYNRLSYQDYIKLPWENEAIKEADKLVNKYENSGRWKLLKGQDVNIDFMLDNELIFY